MRKVIIPFLVLTIMLSLVFAAGCGSKQTQDEEEVMTVSEDEDEDKDETETEPGNIESSESEEEEDPIESKYVEASNAYDKGDYDLAEKLFEEIADYKDSADKLAKIQTLNNPFSIYAEVKPNDIIEFGHYEQDNDLYETEPLEWVVLENDNGKLFLYSKKIIDFLPANEVYQYGDDYIEMGDYYDYHEPDKVEEEQSVTWADSKVRTWLNTNFYDAAFSDEEKNAIVTTSIETEDTKGTGTGWQWRYESGQWNFTAEASQTVDFRREEAEEKYSKQNYSIYGGEKCDDYVFLLSYPEFRHYGESDLSNFLPQNDLNQIATQYARNVEEQYSTSHPIYVMGKYDFEKSVSSVRILTRSAMFPSASRGDITQMYEGYGHCFGLVYPYRNEKQGDWMSLSSFDGKAISTGKFSIPTDSRNNPVPNIVISAGIRPAIWIDTNP